MAKTRTEIVRKSMDKIYRQFRLVLRRDEDKELIDLLDEGHANGKPTRLILMELLERSKKRND